MPLLAGVYFYSLPHNRAVVEKGKVVAKRSPAHYAGRLVDSAAMCKNNGSLIWSANAAILLRT